MKILLVLTLLPFCYGSLCSKGEYWSEFSEICLKCSKCNPNEIIIRKCQSHRDTLCSSTTNHNHFDNKYNDKKIHHFDKGKLHYLKDVDDVIIENSLNYPSLELELKHDHLHKHTTTSNNKKRNNIGRKRINDKFLKWDDEVEGIDSDDDKYEMKKKKLSKSNKHHSHNTEYHHHASTQSSEVQLDYDDIETVLHKKALWNSKTTKKTSMLKEHRVQIGKKAARLAKLEDERKLEEWLIESRKQFKDRKDNLLKTLKEEQLESYENDRKVRLNYPLFNTDNRFIDPIKYDTKHNEKNSAQKKHMESEVQLFKDLIKNEESQEIELATLMSSNKDSSYHSKSATPTHRMFLGEPSAYLDVAHRRGAGHVKDPQEVIKEELGRNIIYEKSKFTVVPISKSILNDDAEQIPFTAAEQLVWDWQALAIVSAVAACLLFFLVITIFILLNARQGRREKHIYRPENEEMSTRVALIQPNFEASVAEGNNTNKFLQQFLSMNEDNIKGGKHISDKS